MKIDITMTAALRPKILERTLASICSNLIWPDGFCLIVDIAPVGDRKYTQDGVAGIVHSYFADHKIRMLPESKQADALKWTWENVDSPYALQWEDDWVLRSRIELSSLIHFMNQDTSIGVIAFDRYRKSVLNYPGYEGKFRYIHSGMWERVKEKSLGGPPALMRKKYMAEVLTIVDGDICLDVLSNMKSSRALMKKWGVYVYTATSGALVEDIGKEWRAKRGLKMVKDTPRGVTWLPIV